jgi:hypothetical protein
MSHSLHSPRADSTGTGAPEEIEVTPAMIEAGLEAFAGYSPRFDSREEMVVSVYRAMTILASGLPHLRTVE